MAWSPQQEKALKVVETWVRDFKMKKTKKPFFYLAGYAGTGKTTLAIHFSKNVENCCFAAFSGKAADAMRKKGCFGARTIHSLIYIADQDKKTGEITFRLNVSASALNDADLLILDECSMVNEEIAKDLLSFGKPILVLGDPAQLPPVEGTGFFTKNEPDFMLTEIHRQAADNPIIYLATMTRQKMELDYGDYGDSKIVDRISSQEALNADQIIVGRNVTRVEMNTKMRKLLKLDPDNPVKSDRLICLKNDRDLGIFNGGIFKLDEVRTNAKYASKDFYYLLVQPDYEHSYPIQIKVHKSFFTDVPAPEWKKLQGSQQFDYAYAISCHKSQGSEFDNLLIYDESYCFRDDKWRWLYTAITRSSTRLTMVKG